MAVQTGSLYRGDTEEPRVEKPEKKRADVRISLLRGAPVTFIRKLGSYIKHVQTQMRAYPSLDETSRDSLAHLRFRARSLRARPVSEGSGDPFAPR